MKNLSKEHMIGKCMTNKDYRSVYVGNSIKESRYIFNDLFEQMGNDYEVSFSISEDTYKFPNGSKIILMGKTMSEKLRGLQIDLAVVYGELDSDVRDCIGASVYPHGEIGLESE